MRVIFMGSPEFSVGALRVLHAAGHEIVAVYSQPPRPKGRGQEIEKTAVHQGSVYFVVVLVSGLYENDDFVFFLFG